MSSTPRANRVDPWGDMHAVPERGLFTGNRGCLVDVEGRIVRHHRGALWIVCQTQFKDWTHALDAPNTWTPLFFLDDAVALAAGHRPCGLCRRDAYRSYRSAVSSGSGRDEAVSALELNRLLNIERLRRGRGRERAADRILWTSQLDALPAGTVIVERPSGVPALVTDGGLRQFGFDGWGPPHGFDGGIVDVLTPPTSVVALAHGFTPDLHPTAAR